MITVSKASIEDSPHDIIRLIYETDEYIYPTMCNGEYYLFEKVVQKLFFKDNDNVFSYKNINVAKENGKVVGILLYLTNKSITPGPVENYSSITGDKSNKFNEVINCYFARLITAIEPNVIYINNLCVDKVFRRRGVAEKLVEHLADFYIGKKIILDCLEENTVAVKFYRKLNFEITEHFQGYSGDQNKKVNCVRFER